VKSTVYCISVSETDAIKAIQKKVAMLITESGLVARIKPHDTAVLKLHFGEVGNTGFVNPAFVRVISDAVSAKGATPVLADTNTLYRGRRMQSDDHKALAHEHGFTLAAVGAEVVIPDDSHEENRMTIAIDQQYVHHAKLARFFTDADALIGIAHFKGHIMTGFGGALKNIGMGCAARFGKLEQHSSLAPRVNAKQCIACGACIDVCSVNAIAMHEGSADIDKTICVGCASCIAACEADVIQIAWESGGDTIQQKMIEYTKAVLDHHKETSYFINFATKITKECDCLAKDDPRICPDIGIFASADPVALDKACLDHVNDVCGKDIFSELHPKRDGMRQLKHAKKLKLGNLDYELISVHE